LVRDGRGGERHVPRYSESVRAEVDMMVRKEGEQER